MPLSSASWRALFNGISAFSNASNIAGSVSSAMVLLSGPYEGPSMSVDMGVDRAESNGFPLFATYMTP